MKVEEHECRPEMAGGRRVTVVSYRLGDRWHCTVDNFDPGARLSRAEGATREEAERAALAEAEDLLTGRKTAPPGGCGA